MSLLRVVQEAAVDDKVSLATLLRKCLVLAEELRDEDLRSWASRELNGYPTDTALPSYRVVMAQARASLVDQSGSMTTTVTVPAHLLPERQRAFAETLHFRQPIAAIEAYRDIDETKGGCTSAWPGDLIALMEDKFNGWILHNAWQVVPKGAMIGLLDCVRNKVLELTLQLRRAVPDSGDTDEALRSLPREVVQHITHNIFLGSVAGNVGMGSTVTQQAISVSIKQGDLAGLRRQLSDWGLAHSDIAELEAALAEDPAGTSLREKPKTVAWLTTTFQKLASGTLHAAKDVTINLIAQLIGQYLGLPSIPPIF